MCIFQTLTCVPEVSLLCLFFTFVFSGVYLGQSQMPYMPQPSRVSGDLGSFMSGSSPRVGNGSESSSSRSACSTLTGAGCGKRNSMNSSNQHVTWARLSCPRLSVLQTLDLKVS